MASEAGSAAVSQVSADPSAKGPERRIFICYPRVVSDFVSPFHASLELSLLALSRSYRVFRDKSSNQAERINFEDYKVRIRRALESSVCCVVVLVPSIFESDECTEEVEIFESLRGSLCEGRFERFFVPIEIVDIDQDIDRRAKEGNSIAKTLLRINRENLKAYRHETGSDAFKKKVDGIAQTIHRQIEAGPAVAKPATDERIVPAEEKPPRLSVVARIKAWPVRNWVMAGVGMTVVAVGLAVVVARLNNPVPAPPIKNRAETTLSPRSRSGELLKGPTQRPDLKPAPQPVVWPKVTRPVELKSPVPMFASAASGAAQVGTAGPGVLSKDAHGQPVTVREGEKDGVQWYELTSDSVHRYIRKRDIPTWKPVKGQLGLLEPVEVRHIPQANAPVVGLLKPEQFEKSFRHRLPNLAEIDGTIWYDIAVYPGLSLGDDDGGKRDLFFSAKAAATNLHEWTVERGCYSSKGPLHPLTGIKNGHMIDPQELPGTELTTDVIQTAEINGTTWARYIPENSRIFHYIPRSDIERDSDPPCR